MPEGPTDPCPLGFAEAQGKPASVGSGPIQQHHTWFLSVNPHRASAGPANRVLAAALAGYSSGGHGLRRAHTPEI